METEDSKSKSGNAKLTGANALVGRQARLSGDKLWGGGGKMETPMCEAEPKLEVRAWKAPRSGTLAGECVVRAVAHIRTPTYPCPGM